MRGKKLVWQDYKKSVEIKNGYKVIYLKSGYNPKHKNTMGYGSPKPEKSFMDYTEKMLKKVFGYKVRLNIINNNIFEKKYINC